MIFMSSTDGESLQKSLANTVFLHGFTHARDMSDALVVMGRKLERIGEAKLEGIRIDT